MPRSLLMLLLLPLLACPAAPGEVDDDDSADDDDAVVDDPILTMETTLGTVQITVYETDVPITAGNFLQYVDDGFFDGSDGDEATVFHRVIPNFMAQGGGFREDGTQKITRPAIVNESGESGLSNVRGTLSMARTGDPNSATSQFFINVVDNTFLDHGSAQNPDGYAVFGEVASGMDVVDAMTNVATDAADGPLTDIVIESFTRD